VQKKTICIIGSGTDGTACALRLFRAGYGVIIIEKSPPVDIYHHLTFSSAYFSGQRTIDDITARTLPGAIDAGLDPDIHTAAFLNYQMKNREIALLHHEQASCLTEFHIDYVVLTNTHLSSEWSFKVSNTAKLISIGFSEDAADCPYIIANDPVYFGQVMYPFMDDKIVKAKEIVIGHEDDNTIAAPLEGVFTSSKKTGDKIYEKDEAGRINDIPILSPFTGWISGLINSGIFIKPKTVFAEISGKKYPGPSYVLPQSSFAVAGGVLEIVIFDSNLENQND